MTRPASSALRTRTRWRALASRRAGMTGLVVLGLVTALVLVGPWVWTASPTRPDLSARDMRPILTALWSPEARTGWAHPLGTDELGRDTLARLMAGGRASLAVGWAAMILTVLSGTAVGVLAGVSRRLDGPLMRLTDLFLALPVLPLLMVGVTLFREPLRAAFGPEAGLFLLVVGAVALTSWMPTARIVRGEVLALKERDFVTAARSMGTTPFHLVRRHLLPNLLTPVFVSASLGLATAILTESALSFLGLGFPPDFPSWGKMLADAVARMTQFPERVILPGLAISATVMAVNAIGDGLRDALDPRSRNG